MRRCNKKTGNKRSHPYQKQKVPKERDLALRDDVDGDLQTILHGTVRNANASDELKKQETVKKPTQNESLAERIQKQAELRERTNKQVDETIDELAVLMCPK